MKKLLKATIALTAIGVAVRAINKKGKKTKTKVGNHLFSVGKDNRTLIKWYPKGVLDVDNTFVAIPHKIYADSITIGVPTYFSHP